MTAAFRPSPQMIFTPRQPARPVAAAPVRPLVASPAVARVKRSVPMAKVYRRRRAVALTVVSLVIGLVLAIVPFVGSADATPTAEGRAEEAIVITVESGDTLWAIAQEIAPGADTREVVHRLGELVSSSTLQPGQQIVVPGYWLDEFAR